MRGPLQQIEAAVAEQVAHDRAWLPRDRRGRWVVIEPGAGRYLKNCPADVRRIADAATPRRGRRFSSLSRARAFARQVDGIVVRWHHARWRRVSPWKLHSRSLYVFHPELLTRSM